MQNLIKLADSKAQTTLVVNGIIIAAIVAISRGSIIVLPFLFLLMISITFSLFTLVPRGLNNVKDEKSLLFFEGITNHDRKGYISDITNMDYSTTLSDVSSQAYSLASITKKKIQYVNYSMIFLVAGIITFPLYTTIIYLL